LRPLVVIDGPAGAGKSTVARVVARRLGLPFLDTGAIYRAVALALDEAGLPPCEGAELDRALGEIRIRLEETRVFLGGRDVSEEIRAPRIDRIVSVYAALPSVRKALLQIQRDQEGAGLVAEGRDMGTVVFPSAPVKVFLTASPEVRARRRTEELRARGVDADEAEILRAIRERDRLDSTREEAPLVAAPGAIQIDASDLTVEQVAERIVRRAEEVGRGT
jgi:cytidylate kinase